LLKIREKKKRKTNKGRGSNGRGGLGDKAVRRLSPWGRKIGSSLARGNRGEYPV